MSAWVENQKNNRIDWLISFFLFLFLSSVYYATVSGITSSNDGSHYALVRTMVENHSFALMQFDDYAEGNDIAMTEDGRLFSDRPPGTALAGTLFYLGGGLFPAPFQELPSRHDAPNPRLAYVLMLPVFAGAGTAVVLYAIMRLLDIGRVAAVLAVLMFSLGTVHWKYSTVLFSHALSSFLVILTIYLTMRLVQRGDGKVIAFGLLGLLLGFSVLTEYSNGLLVIILLGYVLIGRKHKEWRRIASSLAILAAGGLVSVLFLAIYNNVNFGSPLKLSYSYAINYPWASSFVTTFNYPLGAGLKGLLIGGTGDGWCGGPPCPNKGLFYLSPVLLLAIPGWYCYYRTARRECLLTVVLFFAYLILFARHRTYHGFTADGRYLTPFLGLLAIPLAYTLQWIINLASRPLVRVLLLAAAFCLFFLSLGNMFLHIGGSYNYHLDPRLLDGLLSTPQNIYPLLSQVFLNTANLPLLWLTEIALIFLIVVAVVILHNVTDDSLEEPG
jgi:4-amino-4-deoxy-L-arabinose transferase-like glycosyltransferase